MTVEAIWDGTYTPSGAKRLKLPAMEGMWLTGDIQILAEPAVENGKLVALVNVCHSLCFVELRVKVREKEDSGVREG